MANRVSFSYPTWVQTFPELNYITEPMADMYFGLATLYLRNDGCSVIPTDELQSALLNLLTAHIAKLLAPSTAGGTPSGLVGRISNASEGSVSVGTDLPSTPSNAWFVQTAYGFAFWQATAAFRTMRYVPGPQPFLNGPFQGGAWYNRRGTGALPNRGFCWPL